ncbi:MAG: EamA family transporter [Deltaproteobacteria bacterium]|nr:EamA family transporter [Deltaproteobacteria bacterium]
MLWFILAILTALAMSSEGAWLKKYFSHLDPYEMGMASIIYSLPLFAIAMILIPHPPLPHQFWAAFLGTFVLNGIAYFLYVRAIQISPLSLTIPYLAFTPAFMIFTGRILLDEEPSPLGIAGILVSLAGGYLLNLDVTKWSPLEPLRAALRERGSRHMLVVAVIYSVSSVLDKKAILHSSPIFFGIFFYIVFAPTLFILLLLGQKISWDFWLRNPGKGIVAGLLVFAHSVFHVWALSLTKAAYMISVKRLSILFSVIYGWIIFGESNMAARLGGAVLMMLGAVIIALAG